MCVCVGGRTQEGKWEGSRLGRKSKGNVCLVCTRAWIPSPKYSQNPEEGSMGHEGDMEENEEKQQWDPLVGTVAGSLGVRWTMGRLGRENQPGPGECPSASLCLQCATYKLCHPEELVLLGHSLGIPQAPLSRCSIQALQLTKCLSQLHSGLFLYQGLLQALTGISPELAPTVDMLQLDVANFATTIWQQVSFIWRGRG